MQYRSLRLRIDLSVDTVTELYAVCCV